MDLFMKLANRKLGGKARARAAQALAVLAWIYTISKGIDLEAPIGVTLLALMQTIAHDTPLGDKES